MSGKGTRAKLKVPKQYEIINKKALYTYALSTFLSIADFVVLVVSSEYQNSIQKTYQDNPKILVCTGGATRQDSVYQGLRKLKTLAIDLVAVHDSVRPFISLKLVKKSFSFAKKYKSSIPIFPSTSTLVQLNAFDDKKTHKDFSYLDRSKIYEIQTPQTFSYDLLLKAYEKIKDFSLFTDDSAIWKKVYQDIYFFEGEKQNIKITYPEDLLFFKLYNNG